MVKSKVRIVLLIVSLGLLCLGAVPIYRYLENSTAAQKHSTRIKDVVFTLTRVTSQQLYLINYGESEKPEKEKEVIMREYEGFICFILDISIDNFKGEITDFDRPGKDFNYDKRMNYYLFEMQNYIKLKAIDGENIPCSIYSFERLNEIRNANRFLVGFKAPEVNEFKIEYDNPYLDCGIINFSCIK